MLKKTQEDPLLNRRTPRQIRDKVAFSLRRSYITQLAKEIISEDLCVEQKENHAKQDAHYRCN